MKQTKKTKKTESGRSMIEMVGVLAVMGLITAGAFILISSAMSSQKTSRVDDDVSAIVAGTRLLYNSQSTFDGLTSSALDSLGFAGNNPYGGDYYLAGSGTDFNVGIGGLSEAQAKTLLARSWPGGSSLVQCCTSVTKDEVKSCQKSTCPNKATGVLITFPKVQTKF